MRRNFKDYIGASGDLGVIAHVERYIPIPSDSGDPDEVRPPARRTGSASEFHVPPTAAPLAGLAYTFPVPSWC